MSWQSWQNLGRIVAELGRIVAELGTYRGRIGNVSWQNWECIVAELGTYRGRIGNVSWQSWGRECRVAITTRRAGQGDIHTVITW